MQFYLNRRVISVFFMGLASGLPWVMIGSALTLWLKEAGIGRADIGYAGLIFTVYAINFLWSPLVDQFRFSLFRRIGSRRSWVLICQLVIAGSCLWLSTFDPSDSAKAVVLVALLIAFASATQDIAIDAYRVDSFAQTETQYISAAAAAATSGWWTGYAGLGYLPLRLSDLGWSWPSLYMLMGLLSLGVFAIISILPDPAHQQKTSQKESFLRYVSIASAISPGRRLLLCVQLASPLLVCIWAVLGSPGLPDALTESGAYLPSLILLVLLLCIAIGVQLARLPAAIPLHQAPNQDPLSRGLAWMLTALIAPLREFFIRNGLRFALGLLAFILLFKVGEAFLGRMSIVFYKEIGYSNTDIATYSKLVTWWLTIAFALLGGWINGKLGLIKGLFVSGCAMAATNLMFALIAVAGPRIDLYIAAVVLDGFTQAWSTVAFVSFISLMCNHAFSATQYALMASLGNLGRTTLSSISGQVVDWLEGNWALFFVLTSVMVIPSLLILLRLGSRVTQLETDAKNFR
jgi:PAT family beta-lactamase induction signal transducer AmpG